MHLCSCADIQAWETLGISTTQDVMPVLEPVLEAEREGPLPKAEDLRAELQDKAQSIDWALQLSGKAVDSLQQGGCLLNKPMSCWQLCCRLRLQLICSRRAALPACQ